MPRHTEIAHLTSPFLDLINDAYIGSPVSTGTGAQPYPGQLGAFMELTEAEANAASSGQTITLHSGIYQYVQFYASSTSTPLQGGVVFWQTRSGYIVTSDVPTQGFGFWCGVILNKQPTKGNYGWIQVAGAANVKFKSSLTAATPAAGDVVIIDQSATTAGAYGDDPTQSGGPTTYSLFKSVLGIAETAPVASTISVVDLYPRFWNE
jgi:hypothetical protein